MTTRLQQLSSHLTRHVKMGIKTDFHLYTTGTPNGIKVSMLLEELGLEYKVRTTGRVEGREAQERPVSWGAR